MHHATLIKNIGEFFTGDLARPTAPVTRVLIDNGGLSSSIRRR